MFHREDRQLESDHAADLARPQTAAVDDVFGMDGVVTIGDHVPRAVVPLLETRHPRVGVDLGATIACADRIGVRHAVRIDAALVGVERRSDEVLLLEKRIELLGFGDGDDLHVHAQIAAPGLGHAQPIQPFRSVGQHQPAWQVDAALLAGFRLDLPVEIDRVLLQARHVGVAVQRVHPARGMPRGTRGQLLALQQHDVGPTRLGEVVEHAGADDTASYHDHLC